MTHDEILLFFNRIKEQVCNFFYVGRNAGSGN